MIDPILSGNWSATVANLPMYGLVLVFGPVISFLAIKFILLAKAAAAMEKKPREWVFTEERDADGLPMLATARAGHLQARAARLR